MRLIDADKLPKYDGYALSADAVAQAVENAPTVEIDLEPTTSEMLDTYARGYNDGVKMTIHLMLKFRDTLTDQEEEEQ